MSPLPEQLRALARRARARSWWRLAAFAVAGTLLGALLCRRSAPGEPPAATDGGVRIVSLSPPITDTLYALAAGRALVACSDYCTIAPGGRRLPRVGSSVTPNFEAIARLRPSWVVTEARVGPRMGELEALAPTLRLRWLTLADVLASTTRLAELVDRRSEGRKLTDRLRAVLSVPERPDGPRVLLVLASPGRLADIYFIRPNSLHGAALRAAGGRNAVAHEVAGAPRMSIDELLRIDPDLLIVLARADPEQSARLAEPWKRLSALRAVRSGKLGVVASPHALATGPTILDFVAELRQEISSLLLLQPAP